VGYLVIAAQTPSHYIAADQYTYVQIGTRDSSNRWRVPEVLFSRSA